MPLQSYIADARPAAPQLAALSLQSMLNALNIPTAALDQAGRIIRTNAAWRALAYLPRRDGASGAIGADYIETCAGMTGTTSESAVLRRGLSRVLTGHQQSFEHTIRFTRDNQRNACRVWIRRLETCTPPQFLVLHEDMTELAEARRMASEISEHLLDIQLEERQQLADDLHDAVGSDLVVVDLSLSQLRRVAPQTDEVSAILGSMSTALHDVHSQIRTLSFLLHPPWPDEEGGFETAASQFVRGFAARAELRAEVRVKGPPWKIDHARKITLFRILQEALVNVHRHAEATAVTVELTNNGNKVTLRVSDDGRGFASLDGRPVAPGTGILGMRARVMQFRGELLIKSSPAGITLTVTLPTTGGK